MESRNILICASYLSFLVICGHSSVLLCQ